MTPLVLIVRIAGRRAAINGMRSDTPRSGWEPVASFLIAQEGVSLRRFRYRAGRDEAEALEVIDAPAMIAAAEAAGFTVREP